MTLVSIIVPCFQQPQFLDRCIQSVLRQDHTDLEVLVVDDASGDATRAIALDYAAQDRRVRVLGAEKNGGLGAARNIGIDFASGTYLCFLDCDDYLLPGSLTARLNEVDQGRQAWGDRFAGVYSDWQHVGELENRPIVRAPRQNLPIVSSESFTGENPFICSAPLVLRSLVVECGGFPVGLPMLEDFALWTLMLSRGAVFIPADHVGQVYRQRRNSMLRGERDLIMADYVDAILLDRFDSETLEGFGSVNSWLANGNPKQSARMCWNTPSGFGSRPVEVSAAVPVAAIPRPDEPEIRMPSTAFKAPRYARRSADEGPVDVVFSLGSLEQALDVVGMTLVLRETDIRVGVLADRRNKSIEHWPTVLTEIAHVSLKNVGKSTLVIGDDWNRPARGLLRDVPDARIVGRTFGVHAMHSAIRGAARDYRRCSELLVRSNAEAAELGDRSRIRLVPSYAFLGFDQLSPPGLTSDSNRGPLVYVPNELNDHPALDAWLISAVQALAAGGDKVRVRAAPGSFRRTCQTVGAEILSFRDLREATVVATPMCDEVGLFEALSIPFVVFDPFRETRSYVPRWVDHLAVARDSRELTTSATSHALVRKDATVALQIADTESGPEHHVLLEALLGESHTTGVS